MKSFSALSKDELLELKYRLKKDYESFKSRNLSLNMARGKPSPEQIELSLDLLDVVDKTTDFNIDGADVRNYGLFDGISPMKKFFAKLLDVPEDYIFVGGNSSLSLMFDAITCFYTHGVADCKAWCKQDNIKFLCPVPGYDRHFGITAYYNFEMIPIKMDQNGPDMDTVKDLVEKDESVKGIWCVPKYSNPAGITYSDDVVRKFSKLKPAAKDFRIFWDNAYCVHDVGEHSVNLLSIMSECKKNNNEDLPILFTSTSKMTFPGAGVAAVAASKVNMRSIREYYKYRSISFDKINQLRHSLFFKKNDVAAHMQKHKAILKPKFDIVLDTLSKQLDGLDIAKWNKVDGGYFVNIDLYPGTAKKVVAMCKEAGLVLTDAGATYPLGNDPNDSNLRIAPSFPSCEELKLAMELFCVCVKLAVIEQMCFFES